ncbi:hypothetical protein ACWEVD_00930 [Nocardia thailandica]|uniref:Phosphatidic acid phosphatase type 2/haloperoxidase domain-containing protein n=1 Tax=Nocardia farcinica (strain IFM 10152) TaxID=247156 RepID=Q5YMK9_NOCFA|nr:MULTISPECIES: hypothetical protein [Nocardia]BAD60582.1 hypothetical protein PNF1_560 [Nocardia farcinica IFM 10152]
MLRTLIQYGLDGIGTDGSVSRAINRSADATQWLHPVMLAVDRFGIVLAPLALFAARWSTRRTAAAAPFPAISTAVAASGLAYLLARITAASAQHHPPCAIDQTRIVLEYCTNTYSLPDATLSAAAAVAAVLAQIDRNLGIAVWASVSGFLVARVYVGHDYLIDVVLALTIGTSVAVVLTSITRAAAPLVNRTMTRTRRRRCARRTATGHPRAGSDTEAR